MSEGKDKKKYIAYCGLYCGDCPWYTGKIADSARDLRKELRDTRFDKLAEFISDFPQFYVYKNYLQCYEVLGALMKGRCKRACQEGGGPLSCTVRKCCQRRDISGCWECAEFEKCDKLDFLKNGHGDAYLKNLRIIKKKGTDVFFSGKKYWYSVIKNGSR